MAEDEHPTKQPKSRRGGPSSEAGKSVSSRNAVTHGVWSTWLDDKEQKDYDTLVEEFLAEYGGDSATVRLLVERLATATIKLRRIQRVEDALYQKAKIFRSYMEQTPHDGSLTTLIHISEDVLVDYAQERAADISAAAAMPDTDRLDTLARYETTLERQMFRSLQALKILKDERALQSSPTQGLLAAKKK